MKKLTNLEYLRLNKFKRIGYKIANFFMDIPSKLKSLGIIILNRFKKIGIFFKNFFVDFHKTFVNGSWKTKVSYFILGFGNLSRKQILRGLLFLGFQVIFILYIIFFGSHWLGKFNTLGNVSQHKEYDPILDTYVTVLGDDSFKILLYGILTILFIVAYIGTWIINIKQNKINDQIEASGKKIKSGKDDLRSLVDDQFHKTMLALPLTGIMLFTVIPIIFMILVAFTNFDADHDGYANLFTWVGLDNFNELTQWSNGESNLAIAFGEILGWTLMWAIFATFTNYFLGMLVAMLINKRGIKFKKLFRGILVLTIAVPQFISLLYISNMFNLNGIVNSMLMKMGIIKDISGLIRFWDNSSIARVMVILINIWVGIPYLMLITSGVLMNIPQDLYESSKIDGANVWQQYTKITLPYMLFVTGPYLLTSFIGNMNNFNVIYLLTGATPINTDLTTSGGNATDLDLLVTWLFKITLDNGTSNFKLASVIGILVFLVVAIISLIVYNIMPSNKSEEDYS